MPSVTTDANIVPRDAGLQAEVGLVDAPTLPCTQWGDYECTNQNHSCIAQCAAGDTLVSCERMATSYSCYRDNVLCLQLDVPVVPPDPCETICREAFDECAPKIPNPVPP